MSKPPNASKTFDRQAQLPIRRVGAQPTTLGPATTVSLGANDTLEGGTGGRGGQARVQPFLEVDRSCTSGFQSGAAVYADTQGNNVRIEVTCSGYTSTYNGSGI